MYYFAQDCNNGFAGHLWFKGPIYRILDNGTSIDLESEIPIAKQYLAAMENSNGTPEDILNIVQAPFYQRFYEEVQN